MEQIYIQICMYYVQIYLYDKNHRLKKSKIDLKVKKVIIFRKHFDTSGFQQNFKRLICLSDNYSQHCIFSSISKSMNIFLFNLKKEYVFTLNHFNHLCILLSLIFEANVKIKVYE